MMIAIENRSGKIRDRFLFFKSDPDFAGKIDPRFSYENRIAIEKPGLRSCLRHRPAVHIHANLFNFLRSDRDFH
jgi:hypothetical protein